MEIWISFQRADQRFHGEDEEEGGDGLLPGAALIQFVDSVKNEKKNLFFSFFFSSSSSASSVLYSFLALVSSRNNSSNSFSQT